MNDGKENTDSLTEIKEIYLEGVVNSGFYMKETIHDFIVENPDSKIVVDLKPFPVLLAAKMELRNMLDRNQIAVKMITY